ncbi:cupin domain-containing protein [Hoeflea sp. WL0058]|uniref:Cupin domain-containing protein n=1 Tax=Flavimaribacter sediminis TaxID=2865987 RepID=A0AAE3D3M9_9HYPH|nr:cupin domain-containing protein [Flavimaribacter sediminis]MBW8639848.1 cupin domain-containing protein [Flavimaribacter sediminis]
MPKPFEFTALLGGGWKNVTFGPFHEGIEICRLVEGDPEVALLRYEAGAKAPRHIHHGMESILVLEGSQSDDHGRYAAGSLVVNRKGSDHRVWSEDGCVVLIQWEKPVEFIE